MAFQDDAFQSDAFQLDVFGGGGGVLIAGTTVTLSIAGVVLAYHRGTLVIEENANQRNTLEVELISTDSGYRPARGAEILVFEDAIRIFGGLIDTVPETATGNESLQSTSYPITAVDFSVYAGRRHITAEIPAGTLKAALEVVVTYLTQYGVTLDPAQVNGPPLPALSYVRRNGQEVLDELSSLSNGYIWEIDYNKVLRMVAPGNVFAPFTIVQDDDRVIGDFHVRDSDNDTANYIILLAGTGTKDVADFVGAADGVTATFPLHYNPSHFYVINVGGTLVNGWPIGGVNETMGTPPAWWQYNPGPTPSITRVVGPPLTGNIYATMNAQFPVEFVADGSASPEDVIERIYTAEDIFDNVVAQALADSYLARDNVQLKEVEYATFEPGLHPSQVQTIVDSRRNLSGTHLLKGVRITDEFETRLLRRVKCVTGTILPGSFMETYRQWSGSGTASAGAVVTTVIQQPPIYFLGGSSVIFQQSPTPTWVPADAVRVVINTVTRGSTTGTVRVRLRAASGSVTARLQNVTDGVTAGTGAAVTSTSWVDQLFSVSFTSGEKTYELQLLPSAANVDVAGVGYLE